MKRGCVERDVVMLGEMVGQQTDKADEDFLDTLGCLAMYNSTILSILQVEQEYGIEHTQHFPLINMV